MQSRRQTNTLQPGKRGGRPHSARAIRQAPRRCHPRCGGPHYRASRRDTAQEVTAVVQPLPPEMVAKVRRQLFVCWSQTLETENCGQCQAPLSVPHSVRPVLVGTADRLLAARSEALAVSAPVGKSGAFLGKKWISFYFFAHMS